MAHALGPRVVSVLEQLAHFTGVCVLEVQLDVVLRAAGETIRRGGERGVGGGFVLPVELAGVPTFAAGPFVLCVCQSWCLSAEEGMRMEREGEGGGGREGGRQTSKILPSGSV